MSSSANKEQKISQERIFTVLQEPHFTEKASIEGDKSNQYTFKVSTDSTKAEIKAAVEQLFEVSVQGVSTLNVKGKAKRTQRGVSRKKNWKKAYVRLAAGQDIDFTLCLLYTSPSPRDQRGSRMPSSA